VRVAGDEHVGRPGVVGLVKASQAVTNERYAAQGLSDWHPYGRSLVPYRHEALVSPCRWPSGPHENGWAAGVDSG
jgi:hypothetical protein